LFRSDYHQARRQIPIVLARKGEKWMRKDGDKESPIKDGLAAKLLADLRVPQVP
jgi:hypothetical protein